MKKLFSASVNYVSIGEQKQDSAPGILVLSFDDPFQAVVVSSLYKLQAAVFISKSPPVMDAYISTYLQSSAELFTTIVDMNSDLYADLGVAEGLAHTIAQKLRMLRNSFLPATLIPFILNLGKVEWSVLSPNSRRGLVELAKSLQGIVESIPKCAGTFSQDSEYDHVLVSS